MATPTVPQSLVLTTTIYPDYFFRVDIKTSRGRYAAVLAPYAIKPADATATVTPENLARLL